MNRRFAYHSAVLIAAACTFLMSAPISMALADPQSDAPDAGLRVFKSANCMGCHKWSGIGGGGYGGAAANLRRTQLSEEQIEKTVLCGRLTTGMPHFDADAYLDGRCYGLKKTDLGPRQIPPDADHSLRPSEVHAVATYVTTHIKGKGEPDLAQCQAFFGTGTRVCDVFAQQSASSEAQPASSSAGAALPSRHVKVDRADDPNAAQAPAGK